MSRDVSTAARVRELALPVFEEGRNFLPDLTDDQAWAVEAFARRVLDVLDAEEAAR